MTERIPDPTSDSFVHLHVHSEFSLLDGLSRIGEMTKRVADRGIPALALTGHGSMYGVIPFNRRLPGVLPLCNNDLATP